MLPEISKIDKQIAQLYKKHITPLKKRREALVAACPHPNERVDKVFKSNTGNYDPSADIYWAELSCRDCGTHWRADSEENNEEYRFKGVVKKNC